MQRMHRREAMAIISVIVLLVGGLACGTSAGTPPAPTQAETTSAEPSPQETEREWNPTWTPTSAEPEAPTEMANAQSTPTPVPGEPVDEGFPALISAASDCSPMSATRSDTLEILGLVITTTTFLEIRGMEDEVCLLYLRTEKQEVGMSDEMIQQALDAGLTTEEIEAQLEESNAMADLVEGRDGVCRFGTAEDLAVLLTRWEEGPATFSTSCETVNGEFVCTATGDFSSADCEGELFSSTP